jgi:hypothetical protein
MSPGRKVGANRCSIQVGLPSDRRQPPTRANSLAQKFERLPLCFDRGQERGRSRELLPPFRFALPRIPQCYQRGFITPVCTYVIDRLDDHWDLPMQCLLWRTATRSYCPGDTDWRKRCQADRWKPNVKRVAPHACLPRLLPRVGNGRSTPQNMLYLQPNSENCEMTGPRAFRCRFAGRFSHGARSGDLISGRGF